MEKVLTASTFALFPPFHSCYMNSDFTLGGAKPPCHTIEKFLYAYKGEPKEGQRGAQVLTPLQNLGKALYFMNI